MDNANKPAYPLHSDYARQAINNCDDYMPNGLSKRERFAMAAMQGLVSWDGLHTTQDIQKKAQQSVMIADTLLNELEDTND